jgi:hypothetical protein
MVEEWLHFMVNGFTSHLQSVDMQLLLSNNRIITFFSFFAIFKNICISIVDYTSFSSFR